MASVAAAASSGGLLSLCTLKHAAVAPRNAQGVQHAAAVLPVHRRRQCILDALRADRATVSSCCAAPLASMMCPDP